jgi:hypothetical protein
MITVDEVTTDTEYKQITFSFKCARKYNNGKILDNILQEYKVIETFISEK